MKVALRPQGRARDQEVGFQAARRANDSPLPRARDQGAVRAGLGQFPLFLDRDQTPFPPPGSCFLNAEALPPPLADIKGPQMLSQIYLLQSQISNNSAPAPPCPNGGLMLLQDPEPRTVQQGCRCFCEVLGMVGHPFLPPNTATLSYSCHSLVKPGT